MADEGGASAGAVEGAGDVGAVADGGSVDAAAGAAQESAPETVEIGGVQVPIAALSDLPDDVLGSIRRKVTAAGEEREVSLLEALEAVPQAEGWQKKQWEAAQERKKLSEMAERLQGDPLIKAYLDGDRDALMSQAERMVLEHLEREALSPEDREKADRVKELEAKAAEADELRRRVEEQETAQLQRYFDAGIRKALGGVGLGTDARTISRAAMVMSQLIEAEGRDLSPPELEMAFGKVAETIARERAEERSSLLEVDDEDALIELLGEERAKKVAKAMAARASRAPRTAPAAPPGGAQRKAREPRTWEQLREQLRARDERGDW